MSFRLKLILISIGSIIVIAGGVFGGLLLVHSLQHTRSTPSGVAKKPDLHTPTTAPTSNRPQDQVIHNYSKDLGACDIASMDSIKQALGSAAQAISGPDDQGWGQTAQGDIQICLYPLNGKDDVTNEFRTSITKFTDTTTLNTSKTQLASLFTAISGVGDAAYSRTLPSSQTNANFDTYTLYVYSGQAVYEFTLYQPIKDAPLTQQAAQAALLAIAKKASFNSYSHLQ